MELSEAYRECERITWTQARNFAYGIRLLPPHKRRGLAVLYAFARRIDDIGDGDLPAGQKIAELEQACRSVLSLDEQDGTDPVLLALADTKRNFPLVPIEAFGELIDGCVADVRGTRYETFEDLHHYCRCVAGSVGRLSLGIFGTRGDQAEAVKLSDDLGVALQLTNILRDIREDYGNGRIYLPAEDLAKFGVEGADLGGSDPPQTPPAHGGAARPPYPLGPPGRSSSGSSSSRSSAPGTGTPSGGSCCPCSTAAAPPAPAPWPASTAACSSRSRPIPRPS